MSPSPGAAFAPRQAPSRAPRPGGSPAAQPSQVPQRQERGSAPLSLPPPPPWHCRGPQYRTVGSSTMACHYPKHLGGPLGPRSQCGSPWSPSSAENPNFTVGEPKIGRQRRPTTPAQHSLYLASPASPGADPALGSPTHPHPPRAHRRRVHSRLSRRGRGRREAWRAFRAARAPRAALHRGEGPTRITGLPRTTTTPPPALPTWPWGWGCCSCWRRRPRLGVRRPRRGRGVVRRRGRRRGRPGAREAAAAGRRSRRSGSSCPSRGLRREGGRQRGLL